MKGPPSYVRLTLNLLNVLAPADLRAHERPKEGNDPRPRRSGGAQAIACDAAVGARARAERVCLPVDCPALG